MEIENNRIVPAASGNGGQGTPVENQNTNPSGAGQAEAGNSAAAQGDRVSLTDSARQLQALENQVASQPVVDSQRVDAVRQAIADGSFDINADRIADKLISIEQALTDAR